MKSIDSTPQVVLVSSRATVDYESFVLPLCPRDPQWIDGSTNGTAAGPRTHAPLFYVELFPMTGYTKLFGTIIGSTIWKESKETKILWITMLAMANKNGIVEASIPGLASFAQLTLKECEESLKVLLSPDPYSRTKDHEGRRIQEVDGGWFLLNHAKYRAKMNSDERREYLRIKQQQHRSRVNKTVDRIQMSTVSTHAEAEAQSKEEVQSASVRFKKPNVAEIKLQCAKIGLPESEAFCFLNYYESNGWKVGRNPMKSWTAALQNWKSTFEKGTYRSNGKPPEKTIFDKDHEANMRFIEKLE